MNKQKNTETFWTIEQSKFLYHLDFWGENYFDIDSEGELIVKAIKTQQTISLFQLAKELQAQGVNLPVLVRFPHILLNRIERLYHAFHTAMKQYNYVGQYTVVYPIKVNQQQPVLQRILQHGNIGLEAGSKPELMAVLGLSAPQDIVICNGYKDCEYIRLALIGQAMGIHTYIVIEKLNDLALIIAEAKKLIILPKLGIRVKLATVAQGKWQDSGGEKSKFGLNAAQIFEAIELLQQADMTQCVQLMHFHMGSQIANIQDIQKSLDEARYFYAELHALGLPIRCVDVGGGLGVDYDGTQSRRVCSTNYNMQEYANNIVYQFQEICQAMNLPQPDIITEAGRAITAHHAVLITNIFDDEVMVDSVPLGASKDDPEIIQDLQRQLNEIEQHATLESYHNASYWIHEMHTLFSHGVINLRQRAHAEQLYYAICRKAYSILSAKVHSRLYHDVLDELQEKLADKYFINFSLFRSAPDAWAIDQVFPIMPLHRLTEQPQHQATLQDLTCDSDGEFNHYVNDESDGSLPIHSFTGDEAYFLGIFLVGAYQEILGGLHNLFGQTNVVNVEFSHDGNYQINGFIKGESIRDVLSYVHFDTQALLNSYAKKIEQANLSLEQKQNYLQQMALSLDQYTYLK